MITTRLYITTIGIGEGPYCSGQVQVFHDILGLYKDFNPKHARKFIDAGQLLSNAINEYKVAVEDKSFPSSDESFFMEDRNIELIQKMIMITYLMTVNQKFVLFQIKYNTKK